jgi:hypothetical protein
MPSGIPPDVVVNIVGSTFHIPQCRPTRTTRGASFYGALVLMVLLVVLMLEVLAFSMSSAADAVSAAVGVESLALADTPVECAPPPLFSTRVQRVLVPRVVKWRELRLRWSWESSVQHRRWKCRAGKTHGLPFLIRIEANQKIVFCISTNHITLSVEC